MHLRSLPVAKLRKLWRRCVSRTSSWMPHRPSLPVTKLRGMHPHPRPRVRTPTLRREARRRTRPQKLRPRASPVEVDIDMDSLAERINWAGWLMGAEKYEWLTLSKGAQKEFKQPFTSKKWLVENLVVDRKVIRPDQVCPELAHYLPAISQAVPTVAASAEAPK
jgi:hypothetical protein